MPATPATKMYDFDLDGVKFSAEIFLNADGRVMAKVLMQEGSADFNSVFWGDADQAGESFTLEGDETVVNLDTLNCQDVQFDSGLKLSLPVGPGEVLSKDTYLTAGETGFITLPGVTSIDEVAVIGVHATNASTPDGEINAIAGDDLASYCNDDDDDGGRGDDCDDDDDRHDHGRGKGHGKGRDDDDDDHMHHGRGKGRDDDDDDRHGGRGKGRDDDHRDHAHGKDRNGNDCDDDDDRGAGKGRGRDDDDGKDDHKWSLKSLLGKGHDTNRHGRHSRNDDDDDDDDDHGKDAGKGAFSMKFDAAKFYEAFVRDFGSIDDCDRSDDTKDENEDEDEYA